MPVEAKKTHRMPGAKASFPARPVEYRGIPITHGDRKAVARTYSQPGARKQSSGSQDHPVGNREMAMAAEKPNQVHNGEMPEIVRNKP